MKLFNYYNLLEITLILFLIGNYSLISQQIIQKETIKKATILSTTLPGMGQFYNKKYWKIPVIYCGLGAGIYSSIKNDIRYKDYKTAYINRTDGDESTTDEYPNYTNQNLVTLKEYHRDSRDLSILFCILIYILNIVDSTVDAHLRYYNINNNLSLYLNNNYYQTEFETMNISLVYKL